METKTLGSYMIKQQVRDSIHTIGIINHQISELELQKSKLINMLIKHFEHDKDGQKTYYYDNYAVTLKTPKIYRVDKKSYEEWLPTLPEELNVIDVKEETKKTYSVDKERLELLKQTLTPKEMDVLSEFISEVDGKKSINIKYNTNGAEAA